MKYYVDLFRTWRLGAGSDTISAHERDRISCGRNTTMYAVNLLFMVNEVSLG